MNAGSSHFVDYLLEQLAPLRGVTSKIFFGGSGLICGDTQFAMVMGSVLYFVVDDATRPSYERMGSGCFSYTTKKGRVDVRKYFAVPGELIEDQDRLVALAKESVRAANSFKKSPVKRAKALTKSRKLLGTAKLRGRTK